MLFQHDVLGGTNQPLKPPIRVAAGGVSVTRSIDVNVDLSWDDIKVLYSLLCNNQTKVAVNGTLSLELEG